MRIPSGVPPHPAARAFNRAVATLLFLGMLAFGAWAAAPALRGTGDVRIARLVAGVAYMAAAVALIGAVREERRTGRPMQQTRGTRIGVGLMLIAAVVLAVEAFVR